MDSPMAPGGLLSLDEPSETLTLSDMDLDLDEPSLGIPEAVNPVAVTSGPPPSPPGGPKKTVKGQAPPMPAAGKKSTPPQSPLKVTGGLLGHILVDNKLLSEDQRDMVLKLQAQSGGMFKFGELCVKNGFTSQENVDRALKAQRKYVTNVQKEQSRMIRLPEEVAQAAMDVEEELATSRATLMPDAGLVDKWLLSALKHGASDLHVKTGQPLVLRHLGRLIQSKQKPLSAGSAQNSLTAVLDADEKKKLEKEQSVVKCLDLPGKGRARGNIYRHMNGYDGTFRLIPERPPSIASLNLPSKLAKFTTYAQGLVLVTGPIGCGKTTTMAALVDIVNRERRHHILTVERPVEFVHRNQRSLVTQRQVGQHTDSFAIALRAALREDPDVIAVGEMNDLETARLTISAAETGHLVFATLHTDNAVRTVNRVLDIFPPDEQNQIRAMLSESLRGVICQRLVTRDDEPGQIPVVEMLFTTPAMRNLIREQKVYQLPNAISMSRDLGNMTFKMHAEELLASKKISQAVYDQFTAEEA